MKRLIFYSPDTQAGTTAAMGQDEVRHVSLEDYLRVRMRHVFNATQIFLSISSSAMPDLPDAERSRLDDLIADLYWNRYKGLLLPARVIGKIQSAVKAAPGTQAAFVDFLDRAAEEIVNRDVALDAAAKLRVDFRVEALRLGARGEMSDLQTSVSEAFADICLLERATMYDVTEAEAEREPGMTRADWFEEMEQSESPHYAFEDMLPLVVRQAPVLDAIPRNEMPAIQAFAARRHPYHAEKSGLFY